jgi:hypothetical protein
MSQVATVEVTLPPPPAQQIPQAGRIVTVKGSLADSSTTIDVSTTAPVQVKYALDAQGTVEVVEKLANGRESSACVIQVVPFNAVEAVAADPSQAKVSVENVENVPDPPATPAAPPNL